MLQVLVVLAIAAHGIGHSVGIWMEVPRWFQLAWLVPGVAFVAGAFLLWQNDGRAIAVLAACAVASAALEVFVPGTFKPGPYAAALAFNVVLLIAVAVPVSREWLVSL